MSFPYFNTLFPDSDDGTDLGYVVLSVFPVDEDNPKGRFHPDSGKGPTQSQFFAWPSERDKIIAYCLNNNDRDVYTVPALFKQRGNRKASNIAHQWCVYADADDLDIRKVRVEPTMVVETSPNRHHLYWATSTDDPRELVAISKAIAHAHKDDGCDASGWDASQLLRVPGTNNNKIEDDPFTVTIRSTGNPYSIERLKEAYSPEDIPARIPRQRKDQNGTSDNTMPPVEEWFYTKEVVRESSQIFAVNADIYSLHVTKVRKGEGDRSAIMWKLLCELARCRVSKKTAMYIAWEAGCNKYQQDGRPKEELWNELCRAYADPANQPVLTSLDADRVVPVEIPGSNQATTEYQRSVIDASERNPENLAKKLAESVSLLRDNEVVPDDTFIDRYEEWASTKTDAPVVYHRAGAMTLLTCIFGEFGTCPTTFETNLTQWVLLLGPTTRARKSTAMNMWVDVLTELEDERFSYGIGSDLTSEALSIILPKKDGRTSLFFRDEAHGLLYEQEGKRYMVGQREHLTELHGGRVRARVRASTAIKDEEPPKSNIKTNFVLFLCGTIEQVTESLSISDFQSGFLARFIFAEADPPPITKEAMYTEQYIGGDFVQDIVKAKLVHELRSSRQFWYGKAKTFLKNPKLISFSSEAWERCEEAKWEIHEMAQNHELKNVLEPTTARMGASIMKSAILIAMSEREERVEMRHVLKAISLAEEWYIALVKVAGKILHSPWQTRQEEMLSAIRSRTDGITQQDLYRRFRSKMKEKDIESDLKVLEKAGLIKPLTNNTNGRIRYISVARI